MFLQASAKSRYVGSDMLAVRMFLAIALLASIILVMVPASNAASANLMFRDPNSIPTVVTKVLMDANGGVHILWTIRHSNLIRTPSGIWYARFTANGTDSMAPTRIWNSSNVESADMALDLNDNVHVIWAEGPAFGNSSLNLLSTTSDSQLYYAEINSTSNQFTNVTSLTGFGKIEMWPSITIDQQSVSHIVWMEEDVSPKNRTLSEYYGTIRNNRLDRPTLIVQYGNQSFLAVPRPHIVSDQDSPDTMMHIAWTFNHKGSSSEISSEVSYAKVNASDRKVSRVAIAELQEPVDEATVTSGRNGSAFVVWQSAGASRSSIVYVSKISNSGHVLFLKNYREPYSSNYLTTSSDSEENLYLIWYPAPSLSHPLASNVSVTSVRYLRIDDAGSVTDSADGVVSGTVLAIGVSTTGNVYAVSSFGLVNVKPPTLVPIAQAMLGIFACCAGGLTLSEEGRYRILSTLTPLWSELYRSKTLKADDEAILKVLTENPGTRFKEIRSATDRVTVSLSRLAQLERTGYVSSVRVGLSRKFFDNLPADLSSKMIATSILNEIKRSPGIWEGKLAQDLGLSQQIVHYHLKRMRCAGLLNTELSGRRKLYRLANSR